MIMLQIINVVEGKSDVYYIDALLKHVIEKQGYKIHNIKINFVEMKGKGNYCSKSTENKIAKILKDYKQNNESSISVVIYYIDTDFFKSNKNHQQEYKRIKEYIEEKSFKLIHFNPDIEKVLGTKINDKRKVRKSMTYNPNNDKLLLKKLSVSDYLSKNGSNFKLVLEEVLKCFKIEFENEHS